MPGISLAPGDTALVATPTWEQIDSTYNVQSWAVDRGRPDEMSRTDTGTATVELIDRTGDFDPTNPTGAFYGRLTPGVPMGPLVQARIQLQNPVTLAQHTVFRGYISRIQWLPYRSQDHANVTLDLVDGLAYLAACEMAPNGDFGNEVNLEGNIVFHQNTSLDAVQTRINLALDQARWPASLRSIFTGNVSLQQSVYSPRSPVLEVIQDAADAEFPLVANVYIGGPRNPGYLVFHGRYARFNPANVEYNIRTWQLGDDQAATSDPDIVRISPPLGASLDDTTLYNSAYVVPQEPQPDGFDQIDLAGQYTTDPVAVGKQGLRTWSTEGIHTLGGAAARTGLQETKLMADYARDNFPTPAVRVGQLTVKSRRPNSLNGAATWELLTDVDISDIVHLTTTHGGGGGFNTDFYVEGIHYQARPGGTIPYVELTLDVSPRSYYDSNPWA